MKNTTAAYFSTSPSTAQKSERFLIVWALMLNSFSIKIMKLLNGDTEKQAKGRKTIVRTVVWLWLPSLPTNQLQLIYVVVNSTESL